MFLGSSHTFSSVSVAMDVGPGVEKKTCLIHAEMKNQRGVRGLSLLKTKGDD